jgi:hypothetical protein
VRTFFWQCSCLPTILLFPGRYVASLLYDSFCAPWISEEARCKFAEGCLRLPPHRLIAGAQSRTDGLYPSEATSHFRRRNQLGIEMTSMQIALRHPLRNAQCLAKKARNGALHGSLHV